jgi:hypothetical protein
MIVFTKNPSGTSPPTGSRVQSRNLIRRSVTDRSVKAESSVPPAATPALKLPSKLRQGGRRPIANYVSRRREHGPSDQQSSETRRPDHQTCSVADEHALTRVESRLATPRLLHRHSPDYACPRTGPAIGDEQVRDAPTGRPLLRSADRARRRPGSAGDLRAAGEAPLLPWPPDYVRRRRLSTPTSGLATCDGQIRPRPPWRQTIAPGPARRGPRRVGSPAGRECFAMTAIVPAALLWGQHDPVSPGDRQSPNGRHLEPRVADAHP